MTPELIIVDDVEKLADLYLYLEDKQYVAYDCETTGLDKSAQVIGFSVCAEEAVAYYVILHEWVDDKLLHIANRYSGFTGGIELLMARLKDKSLIMHNSIFDCRMAESNFNVKLMESMHTDTMILAHLLDENRKVGLKELGKQYFGEDSTKEQQEMKASILANGGEITKEKYELYKADAHLIGKYGAKDAWLTYKLFLKLVPELYEQNLDKFFYEEESMPLLKGPTYDLNTSGLQIDLPALAQLKKTLEAECLEAKDFIYQEIAPYIKDKYPGTKKSNTFNIGASQQLSWLLFGKLRLEFGTLTDVGKDVCRSLGLRLPYTYINKLEFISLCESSKGSVYSPEGTVNGRVVKAKKVRDPWGYIACDKAILKKLSPKYQWIERLLEYQRKKKILNTYVEGIEERIKYGIINPSFLQHGTTSGRYSSRNPNFQNLPRDDKRVKSCIVPRAGHIFVGADYSQLEPRVFAYYSKDERLLKAFDGTSDFYSVIGMEVYNKTDCTPQKEGSPDAFGVKYKKLRDWSKVIALASTYGATAHQLAPITGKGIDATQQDIDNYFETFPGVANMQREAHELAKTNGEVLSLFGRPRRMPEAKKIVKLYGNVSHKELPYEARNILNLAVNHRIQSTGASIVNRSCIKFYNDFKSLGLNCKIILQVHDSVIVECQEKDAQTVKLLLQSALESTILLEGIKFEAIPKIGRNLSEV